jgi:hypothetical protein
MGKPRGERERGLVRDRTGFEVGIDGVERAEGSREDQARWSRPREAKIFKSPLVLGVSKGRQTCR